MKTLLFLTFLLACFSLQAQKIIQTEPLQDVTAQFNQLNQQTAADYLRIDSLKKLSNDQSGQIFTYKNNIDDLTIKLQQSQSLFKILTDSLNKTIAAIKPKTSSVNIYDFQNVTPLVNWSATTNAPIPGISGLGTDIQYGGNAALTTETKFTRYPGSKAIRLTVEAYNPTPVGKFPGNFRAEIFPYPWHAAVPLKSEFYYFISYGFDSTWRNDPNTEMTFLQLHEGQGSPPIMLWNAGDNRTGNQFLFKVRHGVNYLNCKTSDTNTGVYIKPGNWYDVVVHVIWDTDAGGSGLVELWINGKKIPLDNTLKTLTLRGGNLFSVPEDSKGIPYGGTLKVGLYVYSWIDPAKIAASKALGITKNSVCIDGIKIIGL